MIPAPGSATMHLQILTAQALADNSGSSNQQRSRLNSVLPPSDQGSKAHLGVLENGVQKLELRLVPSVQQQRQQAPDLVVIHPYECSECSLLFQTPEDYLQHQGEHFLGQDKESGESGVMGGFDEARGRDDSADRTADGVRIKVAEKKATFCAKSHQCNLCQRAFTSLNRLAAHTRVHEQGTYECPDCGKMFKKATSLQTHMRTHSGVARYLCVDCGSGFTTEMTLIMHRWGGRKTRGRSRSPRPTRLNLKTPPPPLLFRLVLQEDSHRRSLPQVSVLQQDLHQHDQVPLPPQDPPQPRLARRAGLRLHGNGRVF